CDSPADLHDLLSQIAAVLGVTPEQPSAYQNEIDLVTTHPPVAGLARVSLRTSTVPQAAVDQLAELRSEGVHEILNRPITSEAESRELLTYSEKWRDRAIEVLENNFSRAEQLNFTRLGAVPNVVFPHAFDDLHAKILREYSLQERRLLDIIARHTG
ncbi:MAG: hypothetical protein OEQ29_10150, partial [Alphaproteobacteria bacterium]|nr:hypothetical protein [Alphaproteobacteria bacterium]